jgi:hypothetical protein
LHIQIEGSGTQVAEFTLNGQRLNQPFLPAYQPGEQRITIRMT